ncbi:restriction endonuclease subunit S [Lacihabitans sp. LS3-19]|uniref:restriction endonuclease subunit S n=1 Tax=Lacihabitans sp. LS3-19 TaxID=2487335 RepID=UPI0020CB93E9|nr:restriction endonuclease subunit S [Lacihabitans sp. LS3-19]MCP9767913.1 restriction endonuclease subunit S [Lacihabitans sp. LS3-19]
MKSNYKPLGQYIQPVVGRNNDLGDLPLVGLSIQKKFIPSIANTIGTDMSTYRIIEKNQFAYGPVTSRNGDKITIALFSDYEKALISQAYTPFEVKDTKELDPEYLMMWFRRPEFDRYARFKSHGSAREIFDWDEMCNTKLPIPLIDKQKEIVAEYNVIQNRIALNQQLIQKLEETAQAIYREWFVEGIDLENLPEGWKVDYIGSYVKLSQGLVVNATTRHLIKDSGIPLLRITDLINDTQEIFIDESVNKKNIANKEDIIITRTGQVGLVFRNKVGVIYNNCFKIEPSSETIEKEFLFQFLKRKETYNSMVELASGSSAQYDLTHTAFNTIKIIIPDLNTQKSFSKFVKPIESHKEIIYIENQKLTELKELLLSKLATVEN